jgi:cellulose biosynthesis protein BcsQ
LRGSDVEGLDLLPTDFSYRHLDLALDGAKRPTRQLATVLAPFAEHDDLIVVDCQPSISLVSESLFEAADALVVR